MKKLLLKLVWVSLASWLILGAIIAPPEWRAAFLWTGIGLFAAIAVESVLGPCFTPTGLGFYFDARRFHAHVTWRWDPKPAKAPALPVVGRPGDLPFDPATATTSETVDQVAKEVRDAAGKEET